MKVFIGTDHRANVIENDLVAYLRSNGLEVIPSELPHDPDDDFADFAFDVCHNVVKNPDSIGILICGTGIGMSIAANKVKGIMAARCTDVDDAFYARQHNAANVICLGMENKLERTEEIIDTFINTKIANEPRYLNRVDKIIRYEKGAYNEL